MTHVYGERKKTSIVTLLITNTYYKNNINGLPVFCVIYLDEFKRAVYVATGLKLSPHLVNTVFKIFDVDKDDQLSYKEFIGIMKDRLHRGFRVNLYISSLLLSF